MKRLRKALLPLLLAGVPGGTPPPREKPAPAPRKEEHTVLETWLAEVNPRRERTGFRPTSEEERQVFAALVPRLLQAAARGEALPRGAQEAAAKAHFRLETRREGEETFWLLLEQPGHRRGAGAYAFRVLPAGTSRGERPVLLQTPHGQSDQGTEVLGARLFFAPGAGPAARALFASTLHRYKSRPEEKPTDAEHPADVAHAPTHLFQTATLAATTALGAVDVVQLHGFGVHRQSLASVSAVLSSGLPTHSTPRVARLAEALRPWLGGQVLRYPEDSQELGATRNVQGQLVNGLPDACFIHMELSPSARQRLLTSEEARTRLAQALFRPEPSSGSPDAGDPR